MIKLAGMAGLVLSFGLAGIGLAEDLRTRIRLLEEIQNLISELKVRINYFRDPMFIIFQSIENKGNSEVFSLPARVVLKYKEKGGEIGVLWSETVKEMYQDTPLTPEDIEIFCYMGSYIGQSDYENQLMQFETTEERLECQLNEAREAFSVKGSLYRRIGFFAGALTAVVLL